MSPIKNPFLEHEAPFLEEHESPIFKNPFLEHDPHHQLNEQMADMQKMMLELADMMTGFVTELGVEVRRLC